jgi:hypothetical protein
MKMHAASLAHATAVLTCVVAFAPAQQVRAQSQTSKQPEMQVTLVGCVQREADYRKAQGIGRGGALGTGVGSADEFVLINATRMNAGGAAPSAKDCASASGGDAYELTGKGEDAVKPFVGHWVEITGTMKEAKVATGTAGTDTPRPTGGVDPMNRDLKLFEVDVNTIHDFAPATAATPAPAAQSAATTPRAPSAAPSTPTPAPQASAASRREALPKTASGMPLVWMLGVALVSAAVAMRSVRMLMGRVRL